MFVRLGITNSLRQLGRSMLVLLAMVLAAMSLTSALSLSKGEMSNSYELYRHLLGGEILVSPVKWAGQQAQDVSGSQELTYQQLTATGLSWLETYYPELFDKGYLASSGVIPRQSFTEQELAALVEQPEISGISICPRLPADLTNLTMLTGAYEHFTIMPLPDSGRMDLINSDGPGLQSLDFQQYADSEEPIAWINLYFDIPQETIDEIIANIPDSAVLNGMEETIPTPEQIYQIKLNRARWMAIEQMQLPTAKQVARLSVPRVRLGPDGDFVPDYTDTATLDLRIAGQVVAPTRTIIWPHSLKITLSETGYVHGMYLWVPQKTWLNIWRQVAGTDELPLFNVALKVKDMSRLAMIRQALQERFPQFTFIDVASFAYRMEALSRIDRFYRAPGFVYSPAEHVSLAVPMELGPVIGVLFFLIGGMLIASRMLTGAASRHLEIGIMKSLGARRRDIATMALTEALVLGVFGSCIGYLFVRLGGIAMEVSNGVALQQVLLKSATEGALVVGVASLTALVFALLPALRLANLTVMEVLRSE